MSKRLQSHFFWGPHAPLSTLGGAALVIMASSRLAYALFCSGAIFWVYSLTALVFYSCRKFLPQKGKMVVFLFLTSFVLCMYIFFTGLINPLLVTATWFILVFICPCCAGSGFFEDLDTVETGDILPHVLLEAGILSGLIIAISLIREPLGLGSLSFPGGTSGIIELFDANDNGDSFFPIRFLSIAAGGFIVLGFVTAIFRYLRKQYAGKEGA